MMGRLVLNSIRLLSVAAVLGSALACETSPPVRWPADGPSDDGHGMLTPYTITLRHFSDGEAHTIVRAMAEEFPGYHSHDLIGSSGAVRHYAYSSTAKVFKLEEWLYGLFRDMGLDSEREVLIQVDGIELIVDKLVPTPARPRSPERPRFS